jgi:ferritin-like metal-binding protein YciE
MAQASVRAGATSAEKADTMAELSFPASDPPSATAEWSVHLDASVLHQPVPGTPAVRRLLIDGLQSAYQLEASARDWLPALGGAVATPALRHHLDQLHGETGYNLEQLQRALACFGVSHGVAHPAFPPAVTAGLALHQRTGALFDLAASVAVRRDRAAILSIYTTLQDLAGAAGLTEPLPFLRGCASAARKGLLELSRFSAAELVPAAARADGAPLPSTFVRLAFGAAPDTEAEAS